MGITNSIRAEEGRVKALLRRLPKVKCCYEARRVPETAHGRMYRYARRSRSISYTACEQCVLASRDRSERLTQDRLYLTALKLPLCEHAF